MFYGGTFEQWIGVAEWLLLMVVLFTGIFAVSCILSNKMLHKEKRNMKNNFKAKKAEKKSWFIDVA